MLVTCSVLKPVRSTLVKDEQPLNMPCMLVTLEVFRFSMPVMVLTLLILKNQLLVEVGRASANEASKTTCWTEA